jgi:hypothetical protein
MERPQQGQSQPNTEKMNLARKKFERLRRFTAQPLVSSFEPGDDVGSNYSQRDDLSRRRALYAK